MAQRSISGKITDESGESVPGVNVIVKGTTNGTTSDIDGNYRLSVPEEGGALVFSFIGLATKEMTIGARSVVDVKMDSDTKQLSEVVVVGYGTSLKKEMTGAVSTVSAESLERLPTLSPDQALQGLASGVFVTGASGAPGGGISVRVRGQTSISASNQPLYVIDGVIIQSGNLVRDAVGGQTQNVLNTLNPQDIESMQVLKDAASTAIYGARAANGVVLITTKRGKAGKAQFDLKAWTGVATPTRLVEKLTGPEQIMIENEAYLNDNPGAAPRPNSFYGWDGTTDTDWVDLLFDNARISEYQLSASGGSEKFKYYLSGNYRDEDGVLLGSGFKRLTTRANLDYNATDKLSIGTSINFTNSFQDVTQNDNNIYGAYSAALLTPNYRASRDPETGEYVDALIGFNTNALRAAEQSKQEYTTTRFIGNVNASYNILPGLDFRTDVSYDWIYLREDIYIPSTTSQGRGGNGIGNYNTSDNGTYIIEPTLRYNNSFGLSKFSGVLGTTFQETTYFTGSVAGQGYARPSLEYITSAATITGGDSFTDQYSFQSLFGRVNYSFDEKYLASVSVRRDGSSRFGPDKRYGLFWAVSGGWNFSEEEFFDVPFIEFGKIRASYGVTGNDRIGNFTYIGAWTGGANYLDQPASAPSQIENPELQWEESTSVDFGLELALFKSRLNMNGGVFRQTTNNLLFNDQVPWTTGFDAVQRNIGTVLNEGIELDFNGILVDAGDFKWNISFNIAFLRNEVTELANDEPILQGFSSAIIEGEPLNTFYGLKWLGVDPATGNSIFQDTDGNGLINADDNVVFGDYAPDYLGGISTGLSFKGITLDVFLQFVQGVDVYNNTRQFSENVSANWGLSDAVLRRWQQPGDVTDIPRASQTSSRDFTTDNSRYLSDGSYMRLKNITLAYNFPASILSKIGVRSLRVYGMAQNLITWTAYNGGDPEISTFGAGTNTSAGTDFLTQPQNKMYSVGINIGL
jgi:TonB-linked SusC/RagA family outer membrane protein